MFVPNEYRIENHAKRIIKALKKENKYNQPAEEKIMGCGACSLGAEENGKARITSPYFTGASSHSLYVQSIYICSMNCHFEDFPCCLFL